MLPLPKHVVNAINAPTALTVCEIEELRSLRYSVENTGSSPARATSAERCAPGGVAHERNAVRVEAKFPGPRADVLHRRFDIVDSARNGLKPGLHQAVFNCENGVAVFFAR